MIEAIMNEFARASASVLFDRLAKSDTTERAERLMQQVGIELDTYNPIMQGISDRVDDYAVVIVGSLKVTDPEQAEGLRGELLRSAVAGFAMGAATATALHLVAEEEDAHASHRSHAKTDGE